MDVHVKARKPLARRCRCGMTFDADGCLVRVTPEECSALKADPWLIVDIVEAEGTAPVPAPQPTAVEAPAPEDTHA